MSSILSPILSRPPLQGQLCCISFGNVFIFHMIFPRTVPSIVLLVLKKYIHTKGVLIYTPFCNLSFFPLLLFLSTVQTDIIYLLLSFIYLHILGLRSLGYVGDSVCPVFPVRSLLSKFSPGLYKAI